MSDASWREVAFAVAAFLVVGVAAAVEALTAPLGRPRGRTGADDGEGRRALAGLLQSRRSLTASLLVLEVVALAAAASALTATFRREIGVAERVLAVTVVTVAYLLLGQALPRALARYRAERTPGPILWLGGGLSALARPLVTVVELVERGLVRLLPEPGEPAPPVGTEDELRAVAIADGDDGAIEADEREMIEGVLQLEEIRVREIMVPRVDIIAVERSVPPDELLRVIIEAGHSRIPVYRETIDRVEGVLYAKDLLPFVIGTTEALPLATLLRPPFFVPESKRIDDLLREMRRARVHVAVVVDEYGGTAGLVTIEDILEEIVGEIQDEYDTELPLFEVVGPGELVADGRLAMGDVGDALDVDFAEDDYETLGGFVHAHLGRLPVAGDRFEAEGVRVEILEVEGRRVRRMRLTKLLPIDTAEPDAMQLDAGDSDERAEVGEGADGEHPGSGGGGSDRAPHRPPSHSSTAAEDAER